jgi:L-ascorbate metabolism protein UlaG (beta-lactamase superfamily)
LDLFTSWIGANRCAFFKSGNLRFAIGPSGAGYVIESQERFVSLAGDTTFGSHFAQIREKFGSPQLGVVADRSVRTTLGMSQVPMAAGEAVHACEILGAKTSIAIHHGTFRLADEGIDIPWIITREAWVSLELA